MRALVLVVTVGCGGAARTPEPVRNRAAPPPRPTCTDDRTERLAQRLAARWNTTAVSIVRCTPGLFPTPGFFVEAVDGAAHYTGIIDTADHELVPITLERRRVIASEVVECTTVDLDGDGSDEIVETWRTYADAPATEQWLEVRRVERDSLATIRGPHTSIYHPDLGGCSAEVRLAGRTIVITVEELIGIAPSDCLSAGTHTFALEDDAIVALSPSRR